VAFLFYPRGWHFDALLVLNNKDYSNGRLPLPSLPLPPFPTLTLRRQYHRPYALPPSDVFIGVSLLRMQVVWAGAITAKGERRPFMVIATFAVRRSQARPVNALPNHRLHLGTVTTVTHCVIKF